jgi:hypothetical protein
MPEEGVALTPLLKKLSNTWFDPPGSINLGFFENIC